MCAKADADLIHCDVMDGRFVPAISYGSAICGQVAAASRLPLDVHLMVEDVDGQIAQALEFGPRYITFHAEAARDPLELAQVIRRGGSLPGLAIKPNTPFATIAPIADRFELILIMTVEPGAGGQAFMPGCLPKVAEATDRRAASRANYLIEVDGGIAMTTIAACSQSGADMFVAGSAVFGQRLGIADAISQLRAMATTSNGG